MYSTYPFNIRCARFIHASDTSLIPARSISSALPPEISLRESFLLRLLQFRARPVEGLNRLNIIMVLNDNAPRYSEVNPSRYKTRVRAGCNFQL